MAGRASETLRGRLRRPLSFFDERMDKYMKTAFEMKLARMSYERLVQYLEEAVGSELELPENLDGMSLIDLEFLILYIKSIDLIYSGWSPYIVDAIKQALIRLIQKKMEEEQEAQAFAKAVNSLGRLKSCAC